MFKEKLKRLNKKVYGSASWILRVSLISEITGAPSTFLQISNKVNSAMLTAERASVSRPVWPIDLITLFTSMPLGYT